MRTRRAVLTWAAVTLFITPHPTAAQELGLAAVWARSDNTELPSPFGFGAEARFGSGSWQPQLSLVRYAQETVKDGKVCQAPGFGCKIETLSTSARFTGLRLEVVRTLRLGDPLEIRLGGGLSMNQVSVTSRGPSGWAASLHLPNTGQVGALGSASVAVTPFKRIPLALLGGMTGHWVRWNGCVDPADPTRGVAPFCGWGRFTEVRLGASVTLPRPPR